MRKLAAMWAVGALIAFGGSASAAEIKALITTALKTSIEELAPQFERATGHKLRAAYGPSSTLVKRIVDGEDADFVIVGGEGIDALTRQGKVVDGSSARFARSMIGAAVAKGAAKPDIRTVEAFRRVLLAVNSIAYSDSASGIYLSPTLFAKLGIADQVASKSRKVKPTAFLSIKFILRVLTMERLWRSEVPPCCNLCRRTAKQNRER